MAIQQTPFFFSAKLSGHALCSLTCAGRAPALCSSVAECVARGYRSAWSTACLDPETQPLCWGLQTLHLCVKREQLL